MQGNPFDLEFKLAPILKEWVAAVKANPTQKLELLPIKDTDRPILKLMRLRECLEHCESESITKEAKDAFERFMNVMLPEL